MKLNYKFILVLLCALLLVGGVNANAFSTWSAYGDAWKATNDTYTIIMWNTTGLHTWLSTGNATSAELLVVGGGAGGGYGYGGGGGGGAGGISYNSSYPTSGSISISIGSGGTAGSSAAGGQGGMSWFGNVVSLGGGGVPAAAGTTTAGSNGGSGGGGHWDGSGGSSIQTSQNGSLAYGNSGGAGVSTAPGHSGGGGGGAGSSGTAGTSAIGGNGGAGLSYNFNGTSLYYAGGGGGGDDAATSAGVGGSGVGGNGGMNAVGSAGNAGTGSGGGGAGSNYNSGGVGGSGTVIIKYVSPPSKTIVYFNTTGNTSWTVPNGINNIDYLVIAGGGAGSSPYGGAGGGGGGGGGMLNGSHGINSLSVVPGTILNMSVGGGGPGNSQGTLYNGNDSFIWNQSSNVILHAIGGGYGSYTTTSGNGGSSGGTRTGSVGTATSGQGNVGYETNINSGTYLAGGGGGAGAAATSQNGGAGRYYSITGVSVPYAGGGGGGIYAASGAGYGGIGGGGNGGGTSGVQSGTANSGGGGGGSGEGYAAGSGGSGIIIVGYILPPVASFNATPSSGMSPLNVTFTDNSGSLAITGWNVSLGDGSWYNTTIKSNSFNHVYSTSGVLPVKWYVSTTIGTDIATNSTTSNITVYGQTVSGFTANTTSGRAPLNVGFNVTTSNDNATYWNWTSNGTTWTNSTNQNFTYVYNTFGKYSVTEIASNPYSTNTTTLTNYVTVYNSSPIVNFTANITSGYQPLPVQFTDYSTGSNILWYNWSFGDGSIANYTTLTNPLHTYNNNGLYNITESVFDDGGFNSSTHYNYINVSALSPTVTGFTATPTSGIVPFNVQFNLTNMNNNASWVNWSFGNGLISNISSGNDFNVSTTYNIAGVYTVVETASNARYNNTTTLINYIYAYNAEIANFTASPLIGQSPLSVNFVDTSTNTTAGTTYYWWFGDGNFSYQKNPVFQYNVPGVYTVNHYVTDGATASWKNVTNMITVLTPISASFTYDPTTIVAPGGSTVTFTDTSIGSPTNWNWSFGDGVFSNYQNPSHYYTNGGAYTVSLNASGLYGYSIYSTGITVYNQTFSDFTAAPQVGNGPLTVTFTDTSQNATSWYWDFGDGGTSTNQNAVYTYNSYGIYSVSHESLNDHSYSWNNKTNLINVKNPTNVPPVAAFTVNTTSGNAPLALQLADASTGPGVATSWLWGYKDIDTDNVWKNGPTTQNPVIVLSYGNWSINLTASNAYGSSTSPSTNVYAIRSVPYASFTVDKSDGLSVLNVQFTDTSTNAPTSWVWNYTQLGVGIPVVFSTMQNPTNSFSASTNSVANYSVVLNASNANGGTVSSVKWINVTSYPPYASFTTNVTTGNIPFNVQFTDTSGNYPSSWAWYVNGSLFSNQQNPVYQVVNAGTTQFYLIATNVFGSTQSPTLNITSGQTAPIANFQANVVSGYAPLTVTFTDTSLNGPTSWSWDFGNGNTSILQNPKTTYVSSGLYTVSLTVYNGAGSSTNTQINYIAVATPPVKAQENSVAETALNSLYIVSFALMAMGASMIILCLFWVKGIMDETNKKRRRINSEVMMTATGVILGGSMLISIGILLISKIIVIF